MARICPNCKVKLTTSDHYFCSACGNVLPDNLQNKVVFAARVADFTAESSERANNKTTPGNPGISAILSVLQFKQLFLAILVLIAGFTAYVYLGPRLGLIEKSPISRFSPETSNKNSIKPVNLALPWTSDEISKSYPFDYVPFKAEIAIALPNLKNLAESYAKIDSTYSELFSAIAMDTPAIIFAEKVGDQYRWSLIVLSNNTTAEINQEVLNKYPSLKILKSGTVLVVTSEEAILKQVIDARDQTATNFTHTPVFSSVKNALPLQAKALVLLNNIQNKDYISGLESTVKPSSDLNLIVKSILESKSDYLVIN